MAIKDQLTKAKERTDHYIRLLILEKCHVAYMHVCVDVYLCVGYQG